MASRLEIIRTNMIDLTQIKEIRDICTQICDIYRNKMDQAGYDKNGELYNFKEIVEYKGNLFEVYFDLPPYFHFAENGRRPGKFPPLDAILKWVQFKRLVPRPGRDGKVPSTNQLVYLISRKIATKGTEGKHLFEKTLDDPNLDNLADKLVELITAEFEKEIEKYIESI